MIALAILVANLISLALRWKEFAYYFEQHIGQSLYPLRIPLLLTAILPLATLALDHGLGLNERIQNPTLYALTITAVFSVLMGSAALIFYRTEIRSLLSQSEPKSFRP